MNINTFIYTLIFLSLLSLAGNSPYPIYVRILIAAGFSAVLMLLILGFKKKKIVK